MHSVALERPRISRLSLSGMDEALPAVRVRMMVWLISGRVSPAAIRPAAPAKAGTPGTTS